MSTTAIRVKDPEVAIELSDAGCTARFTVEPFKVPGEFGGFAVELSAERMLSVFHEGAIKLRASIPPVRKAKNKNATSKFFGVCKVTNSGRRCYRAQIRTRDQYKDKAFENEIDAAKQYNYWVIELGIDRPLNVIP